MDDFVLSTSTCRRKGISAVEQEASSIKTDFQSKLSGRDLSLHFDGKAVKEFTDGCHRTQERIAIIVSSPTLDSPQVLGVPAADSSKGVDQAAVVIDMIEEWNIKEKILAIVFDTTASNTGKYSGAVTLVEEDIGEACLWTACLRHVYEVHVKHASECVFGPTTGPTGNLCKDLRELWGDFKDNIDYSCLKGFDWTLHKNTFLEKLHRTL